MNQSYFVASQPRLRRYFVAFISTGCAIALSGCTGDGTMPSVQTIAYDDLAEIDLQPIQVCDDHGGNCAGVNMFADITARILEQANLRVNFLPTNRLNASRFLQLDNSGGRSEFYELSRSGSPGDYGRHEDSTRTSGPINVWFVDEIESSSSATQFGAAWVDANGVVISSETLDYNDGEGRADTVAHEIGHNLGLRHTTFGAGGKENLLTDGNKRLTPGSIDDVGAVSQLTAEQIQEIRNSGFVRGVDGGVSADAKVAMADMAFLANMAAGASASYLNNSLGGLSPESLNNSPAGVSWPKLRLGQLNSGDRSNAAERVPEPASIAGLSLLGLAVLASKKKR